jgi:hypothetical protein
MQPQCSLTLHASHAPVCPARRGRPLAAPVRSAPCLAHSTSPAAIGTCAARRASCVCRSGGSGPGRSAREPNDADAQPEDDGAPGPSGRPGGEPGPSALQGANWWCYSVLGLLFVMDFTPLGAHGADCCRPRRTLDTSRGCRPEPAAATAAAPLRLTGGGGRGRAQHGAVAGGRAVGPVGAAHRELRAKQGLGHGPGVRPAALRAKVGAHRYDAGRLHAAPRPCAPRRFPRPAAPHGLPRSAAPRCRPGGRQRAVAGHGGANFGANRQPPARTGRRGGGRRMRGCPAAPDHAHLPRPRTSPDAPAPCHVRPPRPHSLPHCSHGHA